jgi:hypothetical protein
VNSMKRHSARLKSWGLISNDPSVDPMKKTLPVPPLARPGKAETRKTRES